MKKILTLAAMLIGLSATAQIDSAGIIGLDTTKFNLEEFRDLYFSGSSTRIFSDSTASNYAIHWTYPILDPNAATTVTVNAARFYKFACNGTRGYIFHHDIPVYEFDIYGKLEVDIINQE